MFHQMLWNRIAGFHNQNVYLYLSNHIKRLMKYRIHRFIRWQFFFENALPISTIRYTLTHTIISQIKNILKRKHDNLTEEIWSDLSDEISYGFKCKILNKTWMYIITLPPLIIISLLIKTRYKFIFIYCPS